MQTKRRNYDYRKTKDKTKAGVSSPQGLQKRCAVTRPGGGGLCPLPVTEEQADRSRVLPTSWPSEPAGLTLCLARALPLPAPPYTWVAERLLERRGEVPALSKRAGKGCHSGCRWPQSGAPASPRLGQQPHSQRAELPREASRLLPRSTPPPAPLPGPPPPPPAWAFPLVAPGLSPQLPASLLPPAEPLPCPPLAVAPLSPPQARRRPRGCCQRHGSLRCGWRRHSASCPVWGEGGRLKTWALPS